MTEKTFHLTSEDIRKMESREAKQHGGNVPKDSDASILKVFSLPASSCASLIDHDSHSQSYTRTRAIPRRYKPTFHCPRIRLDPAT